MIKRKELVSRHNPVLNGFNTETVLSPLTVGNGDFAFTADVTGFQTLYEEYNDAPLCTMSNLGWHTEPLNGRVYTLDDVKMTRYESGGRVFKYAVEEKRGNEAVYNWIRHNPHRLNLAKISLVWNGREITSADLNDIRQELELYTGVLHSEFTLFGYKVSVVTVCAGSADVIGFHIDSPALSKGLKVSVSFPYGSYRKNASDWENEDCHITEITGNENVILKRVLDNDVYYVGINGICNTIRAGKHEFVLSGSEFTVSFSNESSPIALGFDKVLNESIINWCGFWESGGAVDFSRTFEMGGKGDKRAFELERRVILSQYLTAVNSAGSLPPQETGLLCNSWYGKFHLEMHIMHSGWLPLWGKADRLEKSLAWYEQILTNAVKNAERNGFKGARWVKMTGPAGTDSPSRIATLLIWQQPHIIYMLELIARTKPEKERVNFMRRYWEIIRLTAEFMADFARYNEKTERFDLAPPLIPAQEEHKPEFALNPAFELCYWRFGLKIAIKWACELNKDYAQWKRVHDNLADMPSHNGLYIAHQNCPDTFENFNRDHPSMLFGYGFINSDKADIGMMSKTLDKVLACWDFKTAWGWDFALMAMTLTRLGRADEAVDVLLMDTAKNSYVTSGNNFQRGREDLPSYLPGNGSLLFALALMLTGYGKNQGMLGFPKNGKWDIETEGIMSLPY